MPLGSVLWWKLATLAIHPYLPVDKGVCVWFRDNPLQAFNVVLVVLNKNWVPGIS
jgi:hypothetical protein